MTANSPPLPRPVRNHKTEEAPLFARLLLLEGALCILLKFEKLHPFFHIGPVRSLMALYLADAAGLLCSPISGHPIVEVDGHPSVKFIDADRFETILQPLLLGLKGRNRRLMTTFDRP